MSFSQATDVDIDWLEWLENSINYFISKNIKVYLTGIGDERAKKISDRIPTVKKIISENKLYKSTSELLSSIEY
jgi:hypothetical protein